MTNLFRIVSIAALIGLALAACTPATPAPTAIPPTSTPVPTPSPTPDPRLRYPRLAKGVNLTGWFWYAPKTDEEIRARFSDAEFKHLRAMGITYVRLPIDLGFLLDEASPDLLNAAHLALVDDGIHRLIAADLAVMVDLHSTSLADSNAANYSLSLEKPAFQDLFVRWWEFFAAHLSQYDPKMVILGPMNEPVFQSNPRAWNPIQVRLVKAIRAKAPLHTIVAVGSMWSGLDSLVNLPPLDDTNLVYDFHFYEPFAFTHQGATWSSKELIPLRNVPYPSDPDKGNELAKNIKEDASRSLLMQYSYQNWNATMLANRLKAAADWAQKSNTTVICTEFGVLRDYAPPEDRAHWISDVRSILESNGIGWAMWDYDENFGLVTRTKDKVTVDEGVARALGLNP